MTNVNSFFFLDSGLDNITQKHNLKLHKVSKDNMVKYNCYLCLVIMFQPIYVLKLISNWISQINILFIN